MSKKELSDERYNKMLANPKAGEPGRWIKHVEAGGYIDWLERQVLRLRKAGGTGCSDEARLCGGEGAEAGAVKR